MLSYVSLQKYFLQVSSGLAGASAPVNMNPFGMVHVLGRERGRDHRNFRSKASKLILSDNPHLVFAFETILKILGDLAFAQHLVLDNTFFFYFYHGAIQVLSFSGR